MPQRSTVPRSVKGSTVRVLTREELETVQAPPRTGTWFPVKHSAVIDTVEKVLTTAGFEIREAKFALARSNARLFSTLDLSTVLAVGVSLAVGIRNSTDKSLPLGFSAGSRVLACGNLAFRSELVVGRKHTRFGQQRFLEEISQAVERLAEFREQESKRIERFQLTDLTDQAAESLMLRSFEQAVISHRLLPRVISEWRSPSFDEFRPRTLWSLFNAFTIALRGREETNPQQFTRLTLRLGNLLDPDTSSRGKNASVA